MRRTVVHFFDGADFGGTEQELLHLLAGLDRARWRPVLLHHPEPALAPLLSAARDIGVELRLIPRASPAARLPHVVRALRREWPAVFHAHQNWPLSCGLALVGAALAGVPARVATTQLFVDLPPSVLLAIGHRSVTAAVDRYIAVSEEVARRLAARFGVPRAKLRVIRNAIDPSTFGGAADPRVRDAWTRGRGGKVVLTVARLAAQKGLEHLIAASAQLPETTFVIAGDGPERARLEAVARAAGVDGRVVFLGHRADVPALLASCDLFVLPSLWEGLPLSVLEAMAAARPVVASHIGGTDEAVVHEETGLLVPPADATALAAAIRRVLSDDALAARFAAAGRDRVLAEFSSAAMVRRVESLYDELLAHGSHGAA